MEKRTIKECANSIIKIMHSKNYSEKTIKTYSTFFNRFIDYCQSINIQYFDMMIALDYANKLTGLTLIDLAQPNKDNPKYIVLLRSLRILGEYSLNGVFVSRFSKFSNAVDNEYWLDVLTQFETYLNENCDYKNRTLLRKRYCVKKMIDALIQDNIIDLNSLNKKEIEKVVSLFIHETLTLWDLCN